jgi:hypothetical protein
MNDKSSGSEPAPTPDAAAVSSPSTGSKCNDDSKLLLDFAKAQRDLHDQRRKIESKVVFTTLSFFVAVAAGFLSGKFAIPTSECGRQIAIPLVFVMTILVIATSAGFLWHLHLANATNKKFAELAEDKLMGALGLAASNASSRTALGWSWMWQTTMIAVFGISGTLFIWLLIPQVAGTPPTATPQASAPMSPQPTK